ncbi:HpcH/HpaI aldolase/citrate lyase family protein [Streptomyces sp. BE230]|uniref:HpcH/HpaI aldolase/citrate lyase family protein n=1 Tax=Streptomyces sp. BE230 TaxID=3002526 RepID=UPI002ED44561|nr:CoA ester lyase [Streptomyces sp. BE230]
MRTPLRSMLSVPGNSDRFIGKARDVRADALAFDLEDSVAAVDKESARATVARTLSEFPAAGRELWVRPNALDSGLLEADLEAVVVPGLDGIHLPKADDVATLVQADHYLTYLERVRGLLPGSVRLMAWIESAAGLAHVEEICRASPRLDGVSLGSEDFTASLGVQRTRDGGELAYARARIANAAAAAGLSSLDGPEADFRDIELFLSQAELARSVGLGGKFCIHPGQVDAANRVFAPTDRERAWARRVTSVFEAAGEGAGAIAVDGAMVDRPVYLRALRLLSR